MAQSISPVIVGFSAGGCPIQWQTTFWIKNQKVTTEKEKSPMVKRQIGGKKLRIVFTCRLNNGQHSIEHGPWNISCNGWGCEHSIDCINFYLWFSWRVSFYRRHEIKRERPQIHYWTWSIAVLNRTASTTIGFSLLSITSPFIISTSMSFAAGAILVMLAESMIPEAYGEGVWK